MVRTQEYLDFARAHKVEPGKIIVKFLITRNEQLLYLFIVKFLLSLNKANLCFECSFPGTI